MEDGVGKTLRGARSRRKVDLAEVEASTKIRVRYLRALENEEWDVLPGETYVRGFIRTYASYLGLDGARLAEEHRRDVGASRPGERLPSVEPAPIAAMGRRRVPRPPPRVLAAIVSAAMVAILVAVGLSSGGGDSSGMPERHHHHGGRQQVTVAHPPQPPSPAAPKRAPSGPVASRSRWATARSR